MAYTKELSDVASWFENCGIDELTPQMVSSIIRKWVPESAIRPTKRAGDKGGRWFFTAKVIPPLRLTQTVGRTLRIAKGR